MMGSLGKRSSKHLFDTNEGMSRQSRTIERKAPLDTVLILFYI
jgi:hypothetical protein